MRFRPCNLLQVLDSDKLDVSPATATATYDTFQRSWLSSYYTARHSHLNTSQDTGVTGLPYRMASHPDAIEMVPVSAPQPEPFYIDPREIERMLEVLRARAGIYKARPVHARKSPDDKNEFSRRELCDLVKADYAAAAPERDYLWQLLTQHYDMNQHPEKTDLRRILKDIMGAFDASFFFGLLRGSTKTDKHLVYFDVIKDLTTTSHGHYSPGYNIIKIYYRESWCLGDYVGTLAHEMAHAYLFIFATNYVRHQEESHVREWYSIFRFIMNILRG
ncbi:hypothetical protein F4780DRAFT_444777 [Xylariomycetidae sp. FL0641]|nr:hypothetical protein F4780DRAFT_444777 [Xylariomycetidae sp. FL0641]